MEQCPQERPPAGYRSAAPGGDERPKVWVLEEDSDAGGLERLGDARRVADALGVRVAVLLVGADRARAEQLAARGADCVYHHPGRAGQETLVEAAVARLSELRPRLVFGAGTARGREWVARVALRLGARLVSPATMVQAEGDELVVTALDASGRRARQIRILPAECALITMSAGVGEAMYGAASHGGEILPLQLPDAPESLRRLAFIPADPSTVDIRFAERLVAGGRGVGSKAGFEKLGGLAQRLSAGLAASRMAVDLGWIEGERQVGQTGKTVAPELYLACGISGASHHLAGISGAALIVAVNSDPAAPIFKVAHLGLVADLHEVLDCVERELGSAAP